jgi:hypothetical protein
VRRRISIVVFGIFVVACLALWGASLFVVWSKNHSVEQRITRIEGRLGPRGIPGEQGAQGKRGMTGKAGQRGGTGMCQRN